MTEIHFMKIMKVFIFFRLFKFFHTLGIIQLENLKFFGNIKETYFLNVSMQNLAFEDVDLYAENYWNHEQYDKQKYYYSFEIQIKPCIQGMKRLVNTALNQFKIINK